MTNPHTPPYEKILKRRKELEKNIQYAKEQREKAKKSQDPKDIISVVGKKGKLPSRQVQHTVYKNIGALLAETLLMEKSQAAIDRALKSSKTSPEAKASLEKQSTEKGKHREKRGSKTSSKVQVDLDREERTAEHEARRDKKTTGAWVQTSRKRSPKDPVGTAQANKEEARRGRTQHGRSTPKSLAAGHQAAAEKAAGQHDKAEISIERGKKEIKDRGRRGSQKVNASTIHTYQNLANVLVEREWKTGFQDPDYTPPKTKPTGTTKKELDAAREGIPPHIKKKAKEKVAAEEAARKKKG